MFHGCKAADLLNLPLFLIVNVNFESLFIIIIIIMYANLYSAITLPKKLQGRFT